jgi:hypothetical protein
MDLERPSRRRLFRLVTVGGLVLASLMPASEAAASLWLVFSPASGPPGTTVVGRTGGQGSLVAIAPVRLPVFMALGERIAPDAEQETDLRALASAALLRVGTLEAGADGNGVVSFRVPAVRSGTHGLFLWCPPCSQFSAGRKVLPVGEFQVTASSLDSNARSWPFLLAVSLPPRRRWSRHRRESSGTGDPLIPTLILLTGPGEGRPAGIHKMT